MHFIYPWISLKSIYHEDYSKKKTKSSPVHFSPTPRVSKGRLNRRPTPPHPPSLPQPIRAGCSTGKLLSTVESAFPQKIAETLPVSLPDYHRGIIAQIDPVALHPDHKIHVDDHRFGNPEKIGFGA